MIRFKCSGAQTCVDPYRGNKVSEQLAASYLRIGKDLSWRLLTKLQNNFMPLIKLVTDGQMWVM